MAPRWSARELSVLQSEWGHVTVRTLSQKLGRGPSGVLSMAYELGLPRGIPQGYVSINTLAKLTGYTHTPLMRILDKAGVPVRKWITASTGKRRRGRAGYWWWVDRDAAVAAVSAHDKYKLACETKSEAARRLGLRPRTFLHRVKIAVGVVQPYTRQAPHVWDEINAKALVIVNRRSSGKRAKVRR